MIEPMRSCPSTFDPGIKAASSTELVLARSKRLADLEKRYRAHAASFPSEWMDYGPHDPLQCDRWINACVACGNVPTPRATGTLVVVRCACGAEAAGAHMRWQAVMNWNKSPLAVHPSWDAIPFFFLSGMDPVSGRAKLGALREHLELRANVEGMRRIVGFRVGSDYLQRLKAYLAWCHYAQGLLNRAHPKPRPLRA